MTEKDFLETILTLIGIIKREADLATKVTQERNNAIALVKILEDRLDAAENSLPADPLKQCTRRGPSWARVPAHLR